MTQVSIIIVTTGSSNRLRHLLRLLNSLAMQSSRDFELLVATERSDEGLARAFQRYFCPCNKHRLLVTGFWNKCRTANAAIKASFGDIVVLLEDDLILEKRCIEKMIGVFNEAPQAGCIYSRCIWVHKEGLSSRGGVISWLARMVGMLSIHEPLFRKQVRIINDHLTEVPVFTMCVACKREALYKAGLFDESIEEPIQGEDYDLAFRIRAGGYIIVANKEAVAHHFTRQVTKKALRASENPKYIEGLYASECYFFTKNLSQVGFYFVLHMVYMFISAFVWAIRSKRTSVMIYSVKGLIRGVLLGIRKHRKVRSML